MSGWIGVDLDGTLAEDNGLGIGQIGPPIPAMVERVKRWLAEGKEVRIVTARAGHTGQTNPDNNIIDDTRFMVAQVEMVRDWCLEHIGMRLNVTAKKDYAMLELWDDRAVQVERNTGRLIGKSTRGLELTG